MLSEFHNKFLEKNAKLNLISRNDEKFLWEKHIHDSLAIKYFLACHSEPVPAIGGAGEESLCLLDIGTGGGFPAIPIAIEYPEIEVYALDSIRKKINAIEELKAELDLPNLHTICERAENLTKKFDIITSRAVAPLKTLVTYAMPLLKKGGCLIAWKSRKIQTEIDDAMPVLKKFSAKVVDIIGYKLTLEENHTRNLVIITNC